MTHFPSILADDDTGKLIAGVIVAVIWGISALSSMVNKASKKTAKATAFRPTPAAAPPPPILRAQPMQPARRVAPIPQRNAPSRQMAPSASAAVQQRARALSQMVARPAPAPAPAAIPRRQPALPAKAPTPNTIPVVDRPVIGNAKATAIRRWLRPESLRKQFILTELLQPPVAMRPPQDS